MSAMTDKMILLAGTRKGLFIFESNRGRRTWKMRGPFLIGWKVYHAIVDTRSTPRIYASCSSDVYATNVMIGDVGGKKFTGAKNPPVPPKMPEKAAGFASQYGIPTTPRVWHVEPGRPQEKKVLYAGTAPAGLFRSEDSGQSWQPVAGLNEHPTRNDWNPGFGGMAAHTIQLDPHTPGRMYVAISAAGAFRSDDEGKTWNPINKAVAKYVGAPKDSMVGT
jgi:hypothetical protein